jgi:hypothetical protein
MITINIIKYKLNTSQQGDRETFNLPIQKSFNI